MNIGVLTSGGDAPGMNAAIRAITRRAKGLGCKVFGISYGYQGLLDRNIAELEARDVGGILEYGGTILHSSRSEEFKQDDGPDKASKILKEYGINCVVAIGGNGTQKGLHSLALTGIKTIGVPSTIDNDLCGTDFTIGFDTAVNTAVWAIDKIRITATSHERTFIVEVMGRDSGFLALYSGLACGADTILVPEVSVNLDEVADRVKISRDKEKHHHIIVLAEGVGHSDWLAYEINKRADIKPYISILGYIQRGGSPTAFDRVQASKLGAAAAEAALGGASDIIVGIENGKIIHNLASDIIGRLKKPDEELLKLACQLHD